MAMTTDTNGTMNKVTRYGAGGALAAGAVALIMFMRSERGKEKMNAMMGPQFAGIEQQLQDAIHENMPLIEESIDRLIELLQQGVQSLSDEINRFGDEAKTRINDYATVLPAKAGGGADSSK